VALAGYPSSSLHIGAPQTLQPVDRRAANSLVEGDSRPFAALMRGSLRTDVLLRAVGDGVGADLCAPIRPQRHRAEHRAGQGSEARYPPERDRIRQSSGHRTAKGGVLAAVETVHSKMAATLDGAILAKMAERGQIVGGIVDEPLDLDAAADASAARIKQKTVSCNRPLWTNSVGSRAWIPRISASPLRKAS